LADAVSDGVKFLWCGRRRREFLSFFICDGERLFTGATFPPSGQLFVESDRFEILQINFRQAKSIGLASGFMGNKICGVNGSEQREFRSKNAPSWGMMTSGSFDDFI
jgi:hypothetical protein